MTPNVIDLFYKAAGSEFTNKVSGFLGEASENTGLAIKSIMPTLLGGLVKKNTADYGAAEIFDFLGEHNYEGNLFSGFENIALGDQGNQWTESGEGILEFIFGSEKTITDSVSDIVASTAGINTHSAEILMKLMAPMLMDVVGKEVTENGMDISGIKNLLEHQKEYVKNDIPVSIYDTLGLDSKPIASDSNTHPEVVTTAKKIKPEISKKVEEKSEVEETTKPSTGNSVASRIIPWIILIALAILLFYVMRTCGGQPDSIKGQ
jgi:hypothetical protein